jgi:transketolase
MAAIMNGMALHGGLLPFGGTFLMFSNTRAMPCAWRR